MCNQRLGWLGWLAELGLRRAPAGLGGNSESGYGKFAAILLLRLSLAAAMDFFSFKLLVSFLGGPPTLTSVRDRQA